LIYEKEFLLEEIILFFRWMLSIRNFHFSVTHVRLIDILLKTAIIKPKVQSFVNSNVEKPFEDSILDIFSDCNKIIVEIDPLLMIL
jgi:hypothetical protein